MKYVCLKLVYVNYKKILESSKGIMEKIRKNVELTVYTLYNFVRKGNVFMDDYAKKRIHEVIAEAVDGGVTAGISVLVQQGTEEIFYDQQGYADVEAKKKIERDTIYRLYSMSKPVTAAAVMILMERGMLDLCQPVSEILPGFGHLMVEEKDTVRPVRCALTSLHLLNMTSGYTYGGMDTKGGRMILSYLAECIRKLGTEQEVSTTEFAAHLGSIPLAYEPGTSWSYGLSADILGAVVEQVSGMRFGDFLEENIFGPLGMNDTGFYVPRRKQDRLSRVYESTGDGNMRLFSGDHLVIQNRMDHRPAFESGGAGLVSTIDDCCRFARMLAQGGTLDGVKIMNRETVRYMTSGGLTQEQQRAMHEWIGLEGHTYSHLMRIVKDPGMAGTLTECGEYGWDGWLGCYFANLPRRDMTILMMQQKKDAGTYHLTRKIRNLILGA